jgi:uncharacterized protein (TIGR02678 family)
MRGTSAEAGAKANAKTRVRTSDGESLSRGAGERQRQVVQEEFREAVRALLMRPLLGPQHEGFAEVYRHAEALREWFLRETGWMLEVARDGARLLKRPADLGSAVRGLDDYDRRRYVLLCLACAVLERADPQITLRILGERLLSLAAEPELASLGFSFLLTSRQERSELVSVCRTLLALGVLGRVAGEEEAFIQSFMPSGGEHADALYDIHRRALAGMLAAVRGPSTWAPQDAPAALEDRLRALVEEPIADSEEGRRTAVRHRLARRLLDDPVVYIDSLGPEARAYFVNQRGPMATRLCEATGLTAEARAEGLALVDETGALTDVAMPAEGTEAHATLLVADFLAHGWRQSRPGRRGGAGMATGRANGPATSDVPIRTADIVAFLREAKVRFGKYWRKSARTAGAEAELAETAVARLEKLHLIERQGDSVIPLPALARFHVGEAIVRSRVGKPDEFGQLFTDKEMELTS